MQDPDSPIGRLLSSMRSYLDNTKVSMFAFFTGLSPDGVFWSPKAFHFMLHTLFCLRVLLAGVL